MNTTAIATVNEIQGKVYALRDGSQILLTKDAEIFEADSIITDDNSTIQLVFTDKSQVSVAENSEISVSDYVFTENDESFVLSIAKGAMRSISGEIVERSPEAFEIKSPLATVGIRGTTTYHKVTSEGEEHAVLAISDGHTVSIGLPNGVCLILTSSMEAINIPPAGVELLPFTLSEGQMEELIFELENPLNTVEILQNLQKVLSNLSIHFTDEQATILAQIEQNISALNTSKTEVTLSTVTNNVAETSLEEEASVTLNDIEELLPTHESMDSATQNTVLSTFQNLQSSFQPPILGPESAPTLPSITPPTSPDHFTVPSTLGLVYFTLASGEQMLLGKLEDAQTFQLYFNPVTLASSLLNGEAIIPTSNGFSFIYNGITYYITLPSSVTHVENYSHFIGENTAGTTPYFDTLTVTENYNLNTSKFVDFNHIKYSGFGNGTAFLSNSENDTFNGDTFKLTNNNITFENFSTIDAGGGTDSLYINSQGAGNIFYVNSYSSTSVTGTYKNTSFTNFENIIADDPSNPFPRPNVTLSLTGSNDSLIFSYNSGTPEFQLSGTPTNFQNFTIIDGGNGTDTLIMPSMNSIASGTYTITSSGIDVHDNSTDLIAHFKNFETIDVSASNFSFKIDTTFDGDTYTFIGDRANTYTFFNLSSLSPTTTNSDDNLELTYSNNGNTLTLVLLGYSTSDIYNAASNPSGTLILS